MLDKTVEAKLNLYRQNKKKEKLRESSSIHFNKFVSIFNNVINRVCKLVLPDTNYEEESSVENISKRESPSFDLKQEEIIENESYTEDCELTGLSKSTKKIDWIVKILKVLLWLILWKVFILLEFGAVYFVCSCFIFIWINLYSGSKRKGPSAYSVFNPNCEHLMGSYTAEKLEKELLYR